MTSTEGLPRRSRSTTRSRRRSASSPVNRRSAREIGCPASLGKSRSTETHGCTNLDLPSLLFGDSHDAPCQALNVLATLQGRQPPIGYRRRPVERSRQGASQGALRIRITADIYRQGDRLLEVSRMHQGIPGDREG